jgi:TldD protein
MDAIRDRWVPGRLLGRAEPLLPLGIGHGSRDEWFAGTAVDALCDAALATAAAAGCQYAAVRVTNSEWAYDSARDAVASGQASGVDRGIGVRVILAGRWGFAASDDCSPAGAVAIAEQAAAMARASAGLGLRRVEVAPEPAHRGWWSSPAAVDPLAVPAHERMALLIDRSAELLRHRAVHHTQADSHAVRERTHYADLAGTRVQQQRVRVQGEWTAFTVGEGGMESMRTLAPPTARGWEYLAGPVAPRGGAPGWDWAAEIAALPELLSEKAAAPSVEPATTTLILDPTHLWLTIHESVGHATELDRALGYEANYAGTTFVDPGSRGRLSYGSGLMHVTGDRLAPHGLATTAFDDEGVAAQQWDIIADGTLVDYQLDRAMAAASARDRSNGCAYADSFAHVPMQRMPNVSLQPGATEATLDDLVTDTEDGLLLLGDNSWSIDMQRYNFQFTPQRAWRIRNGRAVGQVRDVAYQSSTPQFWHALSAIGGAASYQLGGAINCGKGQPGQSAPVSHGCPPAVFADVRVLNTSQEASH